MHPGQPRAAADAVEGVAPATVFPYRAKNDFIILTISDHYDTIADIRIWSPFGLERVPYTAHASTGTAENNGRTAGASLLLRSPYRRRPRISAGNEISMADNSLQKQQKQREVLCVAGHRPAGLYVLDDMQLNTSPG